MANFLTLVTSLILLSRISYIVAFPNYQSLAGLTQRDVDDFVSSVKFKTPPPPPGPLKDTATKLVNDPKHPWKPLKKGDQRGPCPGLNTLASHGWLPRDGIATPAQIVEAVQEGFNMGNSLAVFVTYAAMLVDGNLVTNLMSIGGKSKLTGPDPPKPAIVGGLDTHAVFEGDASMTRADAFFGDNHSFNETQFDEFVEFSNRFGGGNYNLTVATEFRWQRIQESIATNPNFSFVSPRYYTAYAESSFPLLFFVDGRKGDFELPMDVARSFFQKSLMPPDFHRANQSWDIDVVGSVMNLIFTPHPIEPGGNQGQVDTYTVDPTSADFSDFCKLYTDFVNVTVRGLYPNPTGVLRDALNINLDYFYLPINGSCPQIFPYGKADYHETNIS